MTKQEQNKADYRKIISAKGSIFTLANVLIPFAVDAIHMAVGNCGKTYKVLYVFGIRIAYWICTFDK
jgi:hypothetical protein